MVAFREHFLVILEPSNFNIYKNCMGYSTLEFVVGSRSEQFQDYLINLVSDHLQVWKSNYRAFLIKDLKSSISDLIHNSVREGMITVRTICGLSILAFYIATIQGKKLYLYYFTTKKEIFPYYYIFIGENDCNAIEIMNKLHMRVQNSQNEINKTLFFLKNKDLYDNKRLNLKIPL